MNNTLAQVALFVYNRPRHTIETIEALACNRLAADTDLIIFSDGFRDEKDQPSVELTRRMIADVKGFRSVTIKLAKSNFGLAESIVNGVTDILKNHGSVIVMEDDLIASPGFLEYMNEALIVYKQSKIYAISGYTPNITIPSDYNYSTYYNTRNCSWGWATWSDKWENIDWEILDFDQFFKSPQKVKDFNSSGNDLATMLLKCKLGIIHSWSIRFTYHIFKNSGGTIYPTASLIGNSGADGSGTNMKASEKYNVIMSDFVDSSRFCEPNIRNANIQKSFKKFYNTSLIRQIINFIKRIRYLTKVSLNSFFVR